MRRKSRPAPLMKTSTLGGLRRVAKERNMTFVLAICNGQYDVKSRCEREKYLCSGYEFVDERL